MTTKKKKPLSEAARAKLRKASKAKRDAEMAARIKAARTHGTVRIRKLKTGGYSITGKDREGHPIRMRSSKLATAEKAKSLVIGKGLTAVQMRYEMRNNKDLLVFHALPKKKAKKRVATKVKKGAMAKLTKAQKARISRASKAGKKTAAKRATPNKTGSVRIVKLKAGGYSISGKDKLGKPIKMRSKKKSTANAVKRLVADKGYTVAQLRKLEKSAAALRPFVKNPGKVWFPASPPKATKVRKKTPVQLRKKKPAAAKKNPAKKKKSYARVAKIYKQLVARIGKKTPKAKDPLKRIGLVVKAGIHDTPRHYGIYIPSQKLVGVSPQIVFLPDSEIRGVLLHELGHALVDLGVFAKPKKRGYYATERRADVVAKAASGLTIYYGKKNLLQRAGAGARGLKVRPKSLR